MDWSFLWPGLDTSHIDLDAFTDCKLGYFLFCFGGHYSSMLLAVMSIENLLLCIFL